MTATGFRFRPSIILLAGLLFALLAAGAVLAQADDAEEKGRFTRFVEETISTPDRQISLGSIDGLLSSDVRIDRITIADREGVWLTIEDAHLVWSRLALLRGRLDIELLEAERIVASRPPLAAETPDPAASPGFAVPELPVEVAIDRLAVPAVDLAAGVATAEAVRFSVDGAVQLAGGGLDADVSIVRTDERPGRLVLDAAFDNASRQLAVDLVLEEEENGVIANLLGIAGRPSLAFTIAGDGPISDFVAEIALSADGERVVEGRTSVTEAEGGTRIRTGITGRLSPLVPETYRAYVRGSSRLDLDFLATEDGRFVVQTADLVSGVARLAMSGRFAADGFPTAVTVDGRLDDPDGPVPLPGGGTVDEARFQVAFGGADQAWSARFDLTGLDGATLDAGRAFILAEGLAENLDRPNERRLTFAVDGEIADLTASRPDLTDALGGGFEILARGAWTAGSPVTIEIAEVKTPNAAAHFAGTVDGATMDGRYWVNAADIAPFAGLVGRPVAGAVTFDSKGTVEAVTGAFALTIDASTDDLSIGDPTADPLLAGRTTLAGRVNRSVDGLRFEDLRIDNPRVAARLDGRYDLELSDLAVSATLADLAALTPRASGAVSFRADITGRGTAPSIAASISVPSLDLAGRRLGNGLLRFDGTIAEADVDGRIHAAGTLDGVALAGTARLETSEDGARRIDDLRFEAGENRLSGFAVLLASGLIDADLLLSAPTISVIAPLALVEATGAVDAAIRLQPSRTGQAAALQAALRGVEVEGSSLGRATIDLTVEDLFGVPLADGRFSATAVAVGGLRIAEIDGTASRSGGATDFDVSADLAAGRAVAAGRLAQVADGFDLTLQRLELTGDAERSVRLAAPATFAVRGDSVAVPNAVLAVGGGEVRVAGRVGDTVDLSAVVTDVPVSVGNAMMPDLGLSGSVSGSLTASGPRTDPSATFDLLGRELSAAALRNAGIAALDVTASGTYQTGTIGFTAETSVGGGRIRASGTAGERLDVAVTIRDLPAALANAASPGLGARGSLSADLAVAGTPAAPIVAFTARGSGVGAAASDAVGLGPVELRAEGRLEGDTVRLEALRATAATGLVATVSGSLPITGAGLDLDATGSLPLSLADRALALRGARLSGAADFDLAISGSFADPRLAGSASVSGASFTDPQTTTRLTGIALRLELAGDRAVIERFSAEVGGGGRLTAEGSIGIRPETGFPVDAEIQLDRARITDGSVLTAIVSGSVRASGQATGGLSLTGAIEVARAEITVPESLPASARLLDIRHRLPPPNVARTLERARLSTAAPAGRGEPAPGLALDISINAPGRVFVRGRGIDAELAGRVTIRGPATEIRPVGSLEMIRGRIDVIGQRITFDSGRVTLVGDLDPYIDFVASARSGGITVTATVTGQASDPQIILTSTPELPQDEILAQFLFGRSISDLSPVQIARLAAAAAQLAGGGGGTDLLGELRGATGLDDLDVVTDEEGNAAVQAGRYISENVYLGVTAGSAGQTNVTVNLDLTDNLKARAEVGPSSGSSVGLFYEREY